MTEKSGQGLRALAKRLGLDPDRAIAFLSASASQSPDAFDSPDAEAADHGGDGDEYGDDDDDDDDAEGQEDDFQPAQTLDDGVPVYPSPEAAETAASILGLDGVHEMDVDGTTMYAPGSDHEAALDAIDDADDDAQYDIDDTVDASLEAQATGSVDVDASIDDQQVIDLEAADSALTGIVWGAGDHNLALGGKPTPVRVPPETVPQTFEYLKDDLQAGDVTIGFDHPDPDSVAAKTGIVDIGTATAAALSADEQFIVLTDSELENDRAIEAAERGDFDDLDWSVVADVAVRRDDDGQPVTEDGRVVLDATRIRRIDAVDDGAVDQASIERSHAALPDLSEQVQMVQQAAEAGLEDIGADAVVQALQASAAAYNDIETMGNEFDPDDVDDIEAARKQLSAAADVIDEQEQELNAAKAQADAFEGLLAAHDVDPEDFEDATEAAQAVIDEQTEDTRREIAQLEANLAAFDTDEDDVDDRVDALAGSAPTELQNVLNARKAKAFEVQQAQAQKGAAAAQVDQTGAASFAGGQGEADAEANDVALQAMDGKDRIQAHTAGQDPADYVQEQYGLNAAEYENPDALHDDIMAAIQGEN